MATTSALLSLVSLISLAVTDRQAALDVFRAAHPELTPDGRRFDEGCLAAAAALDSGPSGDLLLFATQDAPEDLCAIEGSHGRWVLELVPHGKGPVRPAQHVDVGSDHMTGAAQAELHRLSGATPGLIVLRWGTNNEGEGSRYVTELWSVRNGMLARRLSFVDAVGESGLSVETKLRPGAESDAGVEVLVDRHVTYRGENGSTWEVTLPGHYLVSASGVTATRAMPYWIEASSVLDEAPGRHVAHVPELAVDGDSRTAWCEGAIGGGEGESMRFSFDPPTPLSAVVIVPGLAKTTSLFNANARPRKIEVTARPRAALTVELRDSPKAQRIELPPGAPVSTVELKVLTVYPGSRYRDLCISDVTFQGSWSTLDAPRP